MMRTILISGASRGIGRAIAQRALQDGHRVSLGLRQTHGLLGSRLDPARVCLLYTSPSPRDKRQSRMPSSA